jgi:hypothetical protein
LTDGIGFKMLSKSPKCPALAGGVFYLSLDEHRFPSMQAPSTRMPAGFLPGGLPIVLRDAAYEGIDESLTRL